MKRLARVTFAVLWWVGSGIIVWVIWVAPIIGLGRAYEAELIWMFWPFWLLLAVLWVTLGVFLTWKTLHEKISVTP